MNRPLASALVLSAWLAGAGCGPPPTEIHRTDGQWIWSERDRQIFVDSREQLPGLVPGVWVSTIDFEGGEVRQRLALPPHFDDGSSFAVVVRFDDAFHLAWGQIDDDGEIVRLVGQRLAALLGHVEPQGTIAEVQLDYDCPVRLLDRWAGVVEGLTSGPLHGQSVWVTSLLAHVRRPEYGRLFRPHVDGHLLQVFDTGDDASPATVGEIRKLAAHHAMPFRLGVGAFERPLSADRITDHLSWFAAARPISDSPWYAGLWVFPAGRPYLSYIEAKP